MRGTFNVLVADNDAATASGEAVLLAAGEQDCHLILLDAHMPGMDGFETARHLQRADRSRDIPIVFLAAAGMTDQFIAHGYAPGAADYLRKPADGNLLLNRVRQ